MSQRDLEPSTEEIKAVVEQARRDWTIDGLVIVKHLAEFVADVMIRLEVISDTGDWTMERRTKGNENRTTNPGKAGRAG